MTTSSATDPMKAMLDHRAMLIAQCLPAQPRLSEAEAAKLPIHVTELGETGPVVLIVHGGVQGGLGGGPSTFAKQKALAEQGWRLRLVDRPGFGESPSHGVDDMEADSRWIAAMLGDAAHLIGHSWGGAGSLLAAARRPEAVRSLILVEPALHPLLMDSPEAKDPAIKADPAQMVKMLMSSQSPGDYALAFAHGMGSAAGGSNPNHVALALEADPAQAARVGCSLLQGRMASPEQMRSAAETVAEAGIPVLVITGGWSPSFDAVGKIAARLTKGRHVIVEAPNHFVQLANADEFNKIANAFMREDADHS